MRIGRAVDTARYEMPQAGWKLTGSWLEFHRRTIKGCWLHTSDFLQLNHKLELRHKQFEETMVRKNLIRGKVC